MKVVKYNPEYLIQASSHLLAFAAHIERKPQDLTMPQDESMGMAFATILNVWVDAGYFKREQLVDILEQVIVNFAAPRGPTR